MTSFLCNLMNCTCHLCGTQALGERVSDFDVLERDSGWFGAVSLFRAFAALCLFLQRCRHSTLTSCWKRLNGFGVIKRDLGWFGTVSLVHALAAIMAHICVSSGMHITMGESTSVFIWRFVKLKCAYGGLCIFDSFQNKKNLKKKINFVPQSGPIHTPDHLQIHVF